MVEELLHGCAPETDLLKDGRHGDEFRGVARDKLGSDAVLKGERGELVVHHLLDL